MKNRYDSEKTINDILDVSTKLFIEKGFEKTSIQDIVRGLDGLTRGAIYHHFDSKDDIINAAMRRLLPTDTFLEEIAKNKDLNGMEKMQAVVEEAIFNPEFQERLGEASQLFHDPKFFVEYTKVNVLEFSTYIEDFIKQGNEDGSFDIPYPKYVAEILMLLMSSWFVSSVFPTNIDETLEKFDALQYVFEQMGIKIFSSRILDLIEEAKIEREEGSPTE